MVNQGFVLRKVVGHSFDGNATVSKAESVGAERKSFLAKRLHRNLDPTDTATLEREISMSIELKEQPHILPCEDHFVDGPYLYAIMPEVKVSLYSLMRTRYLHRMPEGLILVILHRLISALAAVHELGHTHGKVCAAHIYLDGEQNVKVGYAASVFDYYSDYEWNHSKFELWPAMHSEFNPFWPVAAVYHLAAAPEADKSFESDIWMVGVVALELIHSGLHVRKREEFDKGVTRILTKRKIPNVLIQEKYMEHLPCTFKKYSDGFVNLVASCLNRDPRNRPSAKELLTWDIFSKPLATHRPSELVTSTSFLF